MLGSSVIHRINNVSARVIVGDGEANFYHPDCLAEFAITPEGETIKDEDIQIDHEYCGGDGRFTRYDDICAGCQEELGESGGVQPEDEDEDE